MMYNMDECFVRHERFTSYYNKTCAVCVWMVAAIGRWTDGWTRWSAGDLGFGGGKDEVLIVKRTHARTHAHNVYRRDENGGGNTAPHCCGVGRNLTPGSQEWTSDGCERDRQYIYIFIINIFRRAIIIKIMKWT